MLTLGTEMRLQVFVDVLPNEGVFSHHCVTNNERVIALSFSYCWPLCEKSI